MSLHSVCEVLRGYSTQRSLSDASAHVMLSTNELIDRATVDYITRVEKKSVPACKYASC